ncbi:helix-turn-helix domain-containing protein [Streptomyces sp. NPDC002055]|uniref:winged helix-turn-helix transcriptional regulator n=1 Tax=Streptomyces sp. NPDC002055 TaxID=3154534 RepID=UPI0033243EB7
MRGCGDERGRTVTESPDQVCPINPVVDLVFSRWTTPILWALEHHGRLRFNELQRLVPAITPKVLTQRLRRLERDGLVVRTYHAEIPPRVEYEISDLGRTLIPVFDTLAGWSTAHLPQVEAARRAYDTAREEEEAWAQG